MKNAERYILELLDVKRYITKTLELDGHFGPSVESDRDIGKAKLFRSLSDAKAQRLRWYARKDLKLAIVKVDFVLKPADGTPPWKS